VENEKVVVQQEPPPLQIAGLCALFPVAGPATASSLRWTELVGWYVCSSVCACGIDKNTVVLAEKKHWRGEMSKISSHTEYDVFGIYGVR